MSDGAAESEGAGAGSAGEVTPAADAGHRPAPAGEVRATGGCLCGSVRYEVRGPLRDVLLCHCEECRRWCGHFSANTAALREDLVLVREGGLRWIPSPRSDAHASRGFCAECGSSLFWRAPGRQTISIAAGSLDGPTGLHVASHWFTSQAGDYYEVPDDGLPRHALSGQREGRPPQAP